MRFRLQHISQKLDYIILVIRPEHTLLRILIVFIPTYIISRVFQIRVSLPTQMVFCTMHVDIF